MSNVQIVEVGPRDGLQNEQTPVPTQLKAEFIENLADAGLTEIEATSFVNPKWVPQLADASELLKSLAHLTELKISVLVPNLRGLQSVKENQVDRIALFTAASDAFTKKNINMTVDESLKVFAEVVSEFKALKPNGYIRAYVSTIVECPISGPISPDVVCEVVEKLLKLRVDEIALGETIGVAVPNQIKALAQPLQNFLPKNKTAWHFHDTRGTAIANVVQHG